MSILIILAQTRTGAMLEIIALLVIAAIIGFLTAYLFYKSVYTGKMNVLKEEIEKLTGRVGLLKDELFTLGENLKEKDKEIADLKKKK